MVGWILRASDIKYILGILLHKSKEALLKVICVRIQNLPLNLKQENEHG